jgi:tRNA A-37 threonylcarbamoyl transferase component Bud32
VHHPYKENLAALGLKKTTDFIAPPPPARLLRDVGDRMNFRIDGAEGSFFLKVHREGAWSGRKTRARQEWDNHLRLWALGIPAPIPVAWGVEQDRSFFMSRALEGETADAFAARWPHLSHHEREILSFRLATHLSRLHRRGYYHRDLYLCHVVVVTNEVYLIDLQRLADGTRCPRHRRIKDLAALLYSSLDLPFSRTDRLRFFKRYHGGGRIGGKGKALIRNVARKAEWIQARERRKGREASTYR